jgi:hypothetical protein
VPNKKRLIQKSGAALMGSVGGAKTMEGESPLSGLLLGIVMGM